MVMMMNMNMERTDAGSGEWDEVFELVKIRVKVNSDQFSFVLRSDNDPLLVLDPLRGRCARDGTRPPDAL